MTTPLRSEPALLDKDRREILDGLREFVEREVVPLELAYQALLEDPRRAASAEAARGAGRVTTVILSPA